MKTTLISAIVATVICVTAFAIQNRLTNDGAPEAAAAAANLTSPPQALSLTVTEEPTEDSWVNGARSTGADERLLSDADSSVCLLTKIEMSGVQGPDDTATCRVEVDDFTGFWKVIAQVPEGSRSEIRCNARCLTWE